MTNEHTDNKCKNMYYDIKKSAMKEKFKSPKIFIIMKLILA